MSEFNLQDPDLIKKIKKSNISDLYISMIYNIYLE